MHAWFRCGVCWVKKLFKVVCQIFALNFWLEVALSIKCYGLNKALLQLVFNLNEDAVGWKTLAILNS
ncbi:MAG: hypothetical protein ACK521_05260 [bacterium]